MALKNSKECDMGLKGYYVPSIDVSLPMAFVTSVLIDQSHIDISPLFNLPHSLSLSFVTNPCISRFTLTKSERIVDDVVDCEHRLSRSSSLHIKYYTVWHHQLPKHCLAPSAAQALKGLRTTKRAILICLTINQKTRSVPSSSPF